jgi:hypothetical protein
MSKGNNPIKVLKTALKRVEKGWTQGMWLWRDSNGGAQVCLEGAIYGFCDKTKHSVTDAQLEAVNAVEAILFERTGERAGNTSLAVFNDSCETTKEDVLDVIKLAIIRLESGWPEADELEEEQVAELFEFLDNSKK